MSSTKPNNINKLKEMYEELTQTNDSKLEHEPATELIQELKNLRDTRQLMRKQA